MLAVGGSGVGIGHDSPTAELHIKGDTTDDQVIIENTNAGAANAPDLTLFRNSASPADDDVLGILRFDGKNDAAETIEYSVIQAKADDVSDGTEDGLLIFKNIIDGSLTETMRIRGDTLLVGKTATDFDGGIFEAGSGGTFVSRSGTPFNVNRNDSDGKLAGFSKDGTEVGVVQAKSGDLNIGTGDTGVRFNDNLNSIQPFNTNTNAFINNTVDLGTSGATFNEAYINGGVYIGGTGSANLLDDYEEGTWTPAYGFLTSGATITYDKANGEYVKIGRQVIARFQIRTDAFSGGSGNAVLGNLPFTAGTNASGGTGTAQRAGNLLVGYSTGFTTKAPQTGYVNDGTDYAILITNDSSDARDSLNDALGPSNFTDAANKNFLMGTVIFTV